MKIIKPISIFLIFALSLSIYACANTHTRNNLVSSYVDINQPLLSSAELAKKTISTKQNFFAAWNDEITINNNQLLEITNRFANSPGYYADGEKRSLTWIKAQIDNCALTNFPSMNQRAIILRQTPLRGFPTLIPHYTNPNKAGLGAPFDNWQDANLRPGFPVLVVHQSLDKSWFYIVSQYLSGWVQSKDIAFIDDQNINWYKNQNLAVIIQRNVVLSQNCIANIGTLLPMDKSSEDSITIYFPVRQINDFAKFGSLQVSTNDAHIFPIMPTQKEIAKIADKFNQCPYGWGELDGNPDCSALLRDIFIPFGFWLPRNSRAQAFSNNFVNYDLSQMTISSKKNFILHNGIPFFSFLWKPGHIMLYIGANNNEPNIYHSIWGLKTYDQNQSEGRYVIGKTIISDLNIGENNSEISKKNLLSNTVERLIILH